MALPSGLASPVKQAQAPAAESMNFDDIAGLISPIKKAARTYHCAMYWGKTKTGKTTLGATYPKPLLLLDIGGEKGTASIQEVEGAENISIIYIDTWDKFERTYDYLAHGQHEYKTVVLDTITKLSDVAIEKVLADRRAAATSSRTQKDYLDAITLQKFWLQKYKDLPMNVVFLAQYKDNPNQDVVNSRQVVPGVGAQLSPSLAGFVESIVDVNGWVHIDEIPTPDKEGRLKGEIKHCLVVKPDGIYSVGIRLPNKDAPCPDRIVDPDYEKINDILNPKKVKQ